MTQRCDLIGNVGVATGAGVGGITGIHAGGRGHNGLVVMTQGCNFIAHIGIAAGTGIGGVTGIHAGGRGHNEAVLVTQSSQLLRIAVTAVAGVLDGTGRLAGGIHNFLGVTVTQGCHFISNVAVAAGGAGVGSVTGIHAGGGGHNGLVGMAQSGDLLLSGLAAVAAGGGNAALLGAGGIHGDGGEVMTKGCHDGVDDHIIAAVAGMGGEAVGLTGSLGDNGDVIVTQGCHFVGNVAVAADTGICSVTGSLAGGGSHNCLVGMTQTCHFIGNIAVTAGAGVGGVTSGLAGGGGHNCLIVMTQGCHFVGNVAVAAGAGIGGIAGSDAGGCSHDGLVLVTQSGNFISNIAVAADGAGVSGVTGIHTGGGGDNSGVVVTQNGNGNRQDDVVLQGSAVDGVQGDSNGGGAVADSGHNAVRNREDSVIGAGPADAALVQIHSLAIQEDGGGDVHGTVGLELGGGGSQVEVDLCAAVGSDLLEQADIGGGIVASDGELGTVVVQVPDVVVLVAQAVVAVAVIVQLPVATVGVIAVTDVHIGVGVVQPGVAVLSDQSIVGGAAGLGGVLQEVPLQVGGNFGDQTVLDGDVLGGGVAAVGLQGNRLILGNDQVLVVAAVVDAVGVQLVIGGQDGDGVECPAAAVVGSGVGGIAGNIVMLAAVVVQVVAALTDVPAAVGGVIGQSQRGGCGHQCCGAVAHGQVLTGRAAVLHVVVIAGDLGNVPAVDVGQCLGAVQRHTVVCLGIGQGLVCLGVDQVVIGAGGDGGSSAAQLFHAAGQVAGALVNGQDLRLGCLRLSGSRFGGGGFGGSRLSCLGLGGSRGVGSLQLAGGGVCHGCGHDQGRDALCLVGGVGILGVILISGADTGGLIGIDQGVAALRAGQLVIDNAVECLQTGFAIGFADPVVVVCFHQCVCHHGSGRGLQLIGRQGCISVDDVVPHAGGSILVIEHAVKQSGQVVDQTLLISTLGHHFDDVHQCNGVPAHAAAPEMTVALGTVPAVMIQTGALVQHGACHPLQAVINALVNISGLDGAGELAFLDGIGILHLKNTCHVQTVQTELPGGPGGAVGLVPVVIAVLGAKDSLLLQLLIDILNGIGKALAVGLVVQQFEHAQRHGNRVHFAGVVVLGRAVGVSVVRKELGNIGHHLIGADHGKCIHHRAVEITPAVLLALGIPGQTAGGQIVFLVCLAQLICIAQNFVDILCSIIHFTRECIDGAQLEHHDQCQNQTQRPFYHFHN